MLRIYDILIMKYKSYYPESTPCLFYFCGLIVRKKVTTFTCDRIGKMCLSKI